MKKTLIMILCILTILQFSSCANKTSFVSNNLTVPEKNETNVKINKDQTEIRTQTKSNENVNFNELDNLYSKAGISNPEKFESTFKEIQTAIKDNDKETLSQYINYPLVVNSQKIQNKNEFIKNYHTIVNKRVINAVLNQDIKKSFVNYQGVMIGNGQMWIAAIKEDDSTKYLIIAVNS